MVHTSSTRNDQRAADISDRGRGWEDDDYRLEAGNRGRDAGYPAQSARTFTQLGERSDREFRDWYDYGHARGWHAHQRTR